MLGFLFKKDKKQEINEIKDKVKDNADQMMDNKVSQDIPASIQSIPPSLRISSNSPESKGSLRDVNDKNNIGDNTNFGGKFEDTGNVVEAGGEEKKDIADLFSPEYEGKAIMESNEGQQSSYGFDRKEKILEESVDEKREEYEDVKEIHPKEMDAGSNVLLKNLTTEKIVSPPLFISVRKYREIVSELVSLKVSITTLESVLETSKKYAEDEKENVKDFLDEIDKVNEKMKYFAEVFKLK